MTTTQPMSFRPSAHFNARLTALAKRTGRSKAFLLESLADEAERCRRYPGLAFRGPDERRRAWIVGTGMDVWEVIWATTDGVETAPVVTTSAARLAAAYHREFPDEVDAFLDDMRRTPAQLETDHPFAQHVVMRPAG